MRVAHMADLGQTYARGSGHHQGGRSGPPALYSGNQDMFGVGDLGQKPEEIAMGAGVVVAIIALGLAAGFVGGILSWIGAGIGTKVAPFNIRIRKNGTVA